MSFRTLFGLIFWSVFLVSSAKAADVPQSFTLDGKLFSDAAATTALQDSSITFTVQILDDAKLCVIYEESQLVSTATSKGYFSVQVGSEVGSLVRTAGDSANTMAQVFQNISLINGKLLSNGAPCTVPPVAAKRRYVRIKILPASLGGVARTLSPDLTIDSVPNAVIAERAETLQGLRAANVLQVNSTGTNQLTQTNLESLFTSTARFNSLTSVIDGTSSSYMRTNSASGAQLPVMAGAPTGPGPGSIWFDSSDSKLKYQTTGGPITVGSGSGTVTSVGLTAPSELSVTGGPIVSSGTIAVTWATQTANKVFASPDGVTGTPSFRVMVANDIPNLPWTKITSLLPTTLLGYGITDAVKNNGGTPSLESGLDAAKGAATTAGRVWISTDTKQIYRDTGSAWDLIGSGAPGGVTNVSSANSYLTVTNGSTTPSLTVNVGTAANTVAAGNDSRITGALQQATAFSGDVSGAYNATSVDKIKGTAVSITALGTGNFLKYDGTNWINSSLSAGDVTGALTYTPVNKAGDTMTGLLVLSADPSANLGSATKQYVDSAASTAQSNAQTYADTKFITKNLPAAPAAGQNGQSIRWNNGTGAWEYYTAGTGGGDFMASGAVPMTGTLKMGGNTIYGNSTASGNLTLESTSDATKGHVILQPTSGNVGIGTTGPGTKLDVAGAFNLREVTSATAGLSVANEGRIYFDDVANKFKVSENGGAYVDLVTAGAGGDLVGPASATDNAIARFDGTTGKLVQNSGVVIDDSGNVGIGTTNPTHSGLLSSGNYLVLNVTGNGSTSSSSAGILALMNNSPTPSAGDVAGRLSFVSMNNGLGASGKTVAKIEAALEDIGNPPATGLDSNLTLFTKNGGILSERMRIDPVGNVGIGTTNPSSALDVNMGAINAHGYYANAPGWNDFFFTGKAAGQTALELITSGRTGGIQLYNTAGALSTRIIGEGDSYLNSGNVGIGNTAPGKLLHVGSASVGTGLAVANFQNVDGTCTITPASSGSGIACSSDERLKENFQDVTGAFALDRILQLQAVTYNFKTSSDDNRRTGYKAQEVQKVAPEFVRENEDGLLQVYYDAFIPWITEAIKTLYNRITGIENHQAAQDREIASVKAEANAKTAKLEAENEKLKQENAAIKAYLCAKDPKAAICK